VAIDSKRGTAKLSDDARVTDAARKVYDACERLLEDKPLEELSVTELVREAGVSRATFYLYFGSKFDVVAGLLREIMGEVYDVIQPFLAEPAGDDPELALRRSLGAAWKVWESHRLLLRAMAEHWHAVPEIGSIWLDIVERFVAAMAESIDRQRAAGLVHVDTDSRQLAAMLIWSTERCMYVAGLGIDDALPDEERIFEPLLALWTRVLYAPRA